MNKCKRCHKEDGECIAGYEHVFDEQERFNEIVNGVRKQAYINGKESMKASLRSRCVCIFDKNTSGFIELVEQCKYHSDEESSMKASLRDAVLEAVRKTHPYKSSLTESRFNLHVEWKIIKAIKKAFDKHTEG